MTVLHLLVLKGQVNLLKQIFQVNLIGITKYNVSLNSESQMGYLSGLRI